MDNITRIVHGTAPDSESAMPARLAMIDMARMFISAQARGELPRVALASDGRITLTWPTGEKVSYLTDVDTSSVPVRKA